MIGCRAVKRFKKRVEKNNVYVHDEKRKSVCKRKTDKRHMSVWYIISIETIAQSLNDLIASDTNKTSNVSWEKWEKLIK